MLTVSITILYGTLVFVLKQAAPSSDMLTILDIEINIYQI